MTEMTRLPRTATSVLAVGASHRTASVGALSELARAAEGLKRRLREGVLNVKEVPVRELVVLATCNRVEVYAATDDEAADEAVRAVRREVFEADPGSVQRHAPYELRDVDAVRHVCRTAAGLDSVVVGEHQISGQVARAFRDAVHLGPSRRVLARIAVVARTAARRVRAETNLGRYPANVSSVAVNMARERLGDLAGLSALVVGAGKAGFLVCKALRASGVGSLVIVNRSPERAREVAAKCGATVASLAELRKLLTTADLVVTATGAEGVVVDVGAARLALANRKSRLTPLVVLDLALPSDVDSAVGQLEGIELLTLEDVKTQVDRHLSSRQGEVVPAEAIVDQVVREYARERDADVEALIGELRRDIEQVRALEVERWLDAREPGTPPSREELDQLTRSIVNKLLHDPMVRLRSVPRRNGRAAAPSPHGKELTGSEGGTVSVPASATE